MTKKVLFFIIILFLSEIVSSQNIQNLDSLITIGRHIPLSENKVYENHTLITKEDIKNSPAKSVEEIISYYAGIDLRRRGISGIQSDVSIRGGDHEQVLLLINGVRITNPQTGHNLWNLPVDASAIERIEVVKGPQAAQYGANAYSGAINIITKEIESDELNLVAEGGSFGSYKTEANLNIGKNKWKNILNASYASSDGYRYNTDFSKKNFFFQGSYTLDRGSVSLQAGFVEKKFGANGFYESPKYTEQYEETQQSIVSLSLDKTMKNIGVRAKSYWTRAQDMYLFVRNKPSIYRNMHIGNNIGAEVALSMKNKLGVTVLGSEFRKELLQSNNLGERGRDVFSVFFEHNFSILDKKLNVTPGFNWANYSNQGDFFYPQIALGYKLDDNNKIYVNAAKVHRLPSYTELYYKGKTNVGNPDLKPENADSYEIGYRFSKKNYSAQVSLFHKYARNAIDWVKNEEDKPWQTFNNSKVVTNGAEIKVKKNFDGFVKSISLEYTYIDKSVEKNEFNLSRYSLENLRNQLVMKLDNQIFDRLNSSIVYRYIDRVTMDNYSLLDAQLSYDLPRWKFYTSMNNIMGTVYSESSLVEMPGFWISAGVNYKLKF